LLIEILTKVARVLRVHLLNAKHTGTDLSPCLVVWRLGPEQLPALAVARSDEPFPQHLGAEFSFRASAVERLLGQRGH